jgi:hypothetical protein
MYLWNLFSRSAHPLIEFGGNEVNRQKANPNSDRRNNLTIHGLCIDISPHHVTYWCDIPPLTKMVSHNQNRYEVLDSWITSK